MFDDREFDLLLEGLDSVEKTERQSQIMIGTMAQMMCRGDERVQEALEQKMEEENQKRAAKMRVKSEQIILLKAKLVQIRQSQTADRIISEATA